jgi:hypothetical protein
MAGMNIYLLNTAASAPNWFGRVQDGGSAPAGALSAFGWTVGKTAVTTPYFRGRIGATALATVAQAASYIDAAVRPVQGTGNAATTAGDSFRSDNPLSGTFAAGNWNFTFGMRTNTITTVGRVRAIMWASANADGTGTVRKLTSTTLVGTTVTMALTTTTYNSTVTWAAPQVVLANEYLFLQIEWQETTAGSANNCSAQFYQASFVTTDFVAAIQALSDATGSPVLGVPDLSARQTLGTSAPCVAGAPVFDAPELVEIVAVTADDLGAPPAFVIGALSIGESTLGQNHVMQAIAVAVQPPTVGAASVAVPAIPLGANDLAATAPSLGTPTLLPITLISPSNLATAPPPAVTATLGQKHVLGPTAFALTSPPALAAAAFAQRHLLTAIVPVIPPPTLGVCVSGQIHVLNTTLLAAGLPVLGAAVLGQAGVMAAIPAAAGAPIIAAPVFGQRQLIAAINAAINPPAFSAASFAQKHLIAATIPAFIPATFGQPALAQAHALATNALIVAPPVYGAVVIGQAGVMAALPIAVTAPTVAVAIFGQKHATIAAALAAGQPLVGQPALGKVLSATALAVGAPALGSSSLAKTLTAAPLGAGPPSLGTPACTLRVFGLTASSLAIGPPVLPVLSIGQSGVMAAVPLVPGAPVLGAPAISQRHVLLTAVVGASSGAPAIGQGNFGRSSNLVAASPAIGALAIGAPKLGQRHVLTSVPAASGKFAYGPVLLGQAGVMAVVPLWTQGPSLPVLTPIQRHSLAVAKLAVGAPALGVSALVGSTKIPRPQSTFAGRFRPDPAVLGQGHQLNAQAASAGAPQVLPALFFEGETFPAVSLAVSAPVLGAPALAPVARFTAITLAPRPVLGRPDLGQVHRLVLSNLAAGRPILTRPRLGEPAIDLDPIGLAVEAPIAAVAVLKVVERLLAVAGITGRPHLTVITGQRGSTPTISNTQRAAPLTGKRTANTITSRKQRTVI